MPPETPPPSIREFARRLLAVAQSEVAGSQYNAALNVTEQLRVALTKFAGADSFASLLRRSLVLARSEVPSLQTVQVAADGRLQGLEAPVGNASGQTESTSDAAAVAITSHLLWLLTTFIGMPSTIRLLRDAWPDAGLDTYQSNSEDKA